MAELFVKGDPVVGSLPPTGARPPKEWPEALDIDGFMKSALESNRDLLASLKQDPNAK